MVSPLASLSIRIVMSDRYWAEGSSPVLWGETSDAGTTGDGRALTLTKRGWRATEAEPGGTVVGVPGIEAPPGVEAINCDKRSA